jgi:hypothetical protein
MNDQLDNHLQRSLRRWAAAQNPPKNARTRLLLQAASPFSPAEAPQEELLNQQIGLLKPYVGFPHRDLSGMAEFLWASQLRLPTMQGLT